jgi:hypothetical protein
LIPFSMLAQRRFKFLTPIIEEGENAKKHGVGH